MTSHTIILNPDQNSFYSQEFDDIYFSKQGGLEEKRYVFIQGNDLIKRWEQPQELFTITEIGFGLGLNFLASWQAWEDKQNSHGKLHYVAVEQYLPPLESHQQLAVWWPELRPYSLKLAEHYHGLMPGITHLMLTPTLHLTLLHGEINQMLPSIPSAIDAWYLDGFSPAKNPQMWSEELFQVMKRCTAQAGTVATYTAASKVKKGLSEAGFMINKIPGYGYKREMITGKMFNAA